MGKHWQIIEHDTGDTITYLNGKVHSRNDYPAITTKSGYKIWFINGSLHRDNGPAFIPPKGRSEYWINGNKISYEEWLTRKKNIA